MLRMVTHDNIIFLDKYNFLKSSCVFENRVKCTQLSYERERNDGSYELR